MKVSRFFSLLGVALLSIFLLIPPSSSLAEISATQSLTIKVLPGCSASGGTAINGTCRFSANTCPSGWVQDGGWKTYAQNSCRVFSTSTSCRNNRSGTSLTAPARSWSNNASPPRAGANVWMRCAGKTNGANWPSASPHCTCFSSPGGTCQAMPVQVGCRPAS